MDDLITEHLRASLRDGLFLSTLNGHASPQHLLEKALRGELGTPTAKKVEA